jgi:hypothetical protein
MSIFNFMMAYDFDRPEKEILCDLVYFTNQYKLVPPVVEFGTPMELDPRPDIEDDANAYIPAVVDQKWDHRLVPDETGFLYIRVPLGAVRMKEDTIIQPLTIPFKTYDILDQINKQLGTRLTVDDLENTEYTTMDDDFVLHAKPTSRVWFGKRFLSVLGGGKKTLLFPNYLSSGLPAIWNIRADKKNQLTEIANSNNAVSWTRLVDFDFGNVEPGITNAAGRNTRVFVRALKEGYFDQWLYFARADPKTINDQFKGEIPKVVVPREPFKTHDIIEKINLALNLNLSIDDIENTQYEPGMDEYPIKFKSSSFSYLPGIYMLQVIPEDIKLKNVRLVGDGSYRLSGPTAYRAYE